MKDASKKYKSDLNSAYLSYQQKFSAKLRNTAKYDSKSFWRILNDIGKKKQDNTDISLETLFEYFKKINENENLDDDFEIDINNENVPTDIDNILNGPITEEEIHRAVNSLKNGKATGFDNILNEYIKSSLNELMPIYIRLLNIIFDTGIIPENWSTGILIPIF